MTRMPPAGYPAPQYLQSDRVSKNPIHPQPTPYRRDRVGGRRLDLPRPIHHGRELGALGPPVVQQRHHRVQTEQARHQPQYRRLGPAPRRLQPQIGPHLLEGGLNRPPTRNSLDHHQRGHLRIGAEEVIVPVQSWTKAQQTGTRPSPDLYHWPVSLTTSTSRRPPPYQGTFSAMRGAWATVTSGDGSLAPFWRGRPYRLPTTTGGGSYRLASGPNRLTSVRRRRCRYAKRAIS